MSTANDTTAKVAVITRTKDRPVLLRRAIESVLGQTFDDVQLCIVNDGGDRKVVDELVQQYAGRARRPIQLLHNETSLGVGGAGNAGVEATRSKYITVHDDDDSWHQNFLAATVGHLEKTDSLGVMTRTEVVFETVEGDAIKMDRREVLAADITEVSLFQALQRNVNPPISFVYRREVHNEIGLYDPTLPVLEDWDFYLRFLMKHEIDFIDGEPLAFWHHREKSVGAMSNSVVSGRNAHDHYNLVIRDRYLRRGPGGEGPLGHLLFLAELQYRENLAQERRAEHTSTQLVEALTALGHLRVMADGNREHLQILADGNREHLNTIAARMDYLNDLQTRRMTAQLDELNCRLKRIEGFVSLRIPKANLKGLARRSIAKFRRG